MEAAATIYMKRESSVGAGTKLTPFIERLHLAKIDWEESSESAYVFIATIHGKDIFLRLNDFPAEPLCTLFVDSDELDVEHFPKTWTLPEHRGEAPNGDQ